MRLTTSQHGPVVEADEPAAKPTPMPNRCGRCPVPSGSGSVGSVFPLAQVSSIHDRSSRRRALDRDETHENCPRNAVRASRRNARVAVSVSGHERWVVDEVSC
jgi:hypothetical protein